MSAARESTVARHLSKPAKSSNTLYIQGYTMSHTPRMTSDGTATTHPLEWQSKITGRYLEFLGNVKTVTVSCDVNVELRERLAIAAPRLFLPPEICHQLPHSSKPTPNRLMSNSLIGALRNTVRLGNPLLQVHPSSSSQMHGNIDTHYTASRTTLYPSRLYAYLLAVLQVFFSGSSFHFSFTRNSVFHFM